MNDLKESFQGKRVLITGHTGFKGSWLSLWLKSIGASVLGFSLEPKESPNLFHLAGIERAIRHVVGDVRDYPFLQETIQRFQPEIVFHLAAQALVLPSYDDPKGTFETNVNGTLNLLEAIRHTPSVKACVIVTTDKCYRNKEWHWGYRENEELGGNDPYSASKSMAELLAASYRVSFFEKGSGFPYIATARAGNVIGGGDFSAQRILPDCFRALSQGQSIEIRNPKSVRPWLHVLDPLYGYLKLGSKLLQEGRHFAEAWNFGPLETQGVLVSQVVEEVIFHYGKGSWKLADERAPLKEMNLLRLSWEKASQKLSWKPVYDWKSAIKETVEWQKSYEEGKEIYTVCMEQIEKYTIEVKEKELCALMS